MAKNCLTSKSACLRACKLSRCVSYCPWWCVVVLPLVFLWERFNYSEISEAHLEPHAQIFSVLTLNMTKFTCIIAQERVFSNLLKHLWLLLHIKPHRKLFSIFFSTFEKVGSPLIDNIYKKICRTSRSCRRLQCNIFCLPRRLEDVLKTYLQDVLQTRLEDVLKTS